MTTTVLVPLDGSPLAERVLPLAVRLARAAGGRLVLMRVLSRDAGSVELAVSEVQTYLEYTAAGLREQGVSVETTIGSGAAAAEILGAAQQYAADVLAMSTHGRSGPGRWLHGSVADEVLRRTSTPVVLLPPGVRTEPTTDRAPRILVPLDGSKLAEAALRPAYDWAARLGAEIVLLEVVFWPPTVVADDAELMALDPEEELGVAREYLDEVATRCRSSATPIRHRVLLGRPPAQVIDQVAAEEQVDLIAMATHGRGGIARVVLGSVATGALQHANVPVLIIRPPALAAAAA